MLIYLTRLHADSAEIAGQFSSGQITRDDVRSNDYLISRRAFGGQLIRRLLMLLPDQNCAEHVRPFAAPQL